MYSFKKKKKDLNLKIWNFFNDQLENEIISRTKNDKKGDYEKEKNEMKESKEKHNKEKHRKDEIKRTKFEKTAASCKYTIV